MWLLNKSDGDVEDGEWFMVLPPDVTFISSSITLQRDGDKLILDPVDINAKAKLQFTVVVRVDADADSRFTFRSFLDDFDEYCEATDALTVRT